MDLNSDIFSDYTATVWMCLMDNFFDIAIGALVIILIYSLLVLYSVYYKIWNVNEDFKLKVFQELHEATIENNLIKVVRSIKKCPEAINFIHPLDGYSPFMRACLHGNTQLVNIMLRWGADISLKSSKGEAPFYLAVFNLIHCPTSTDSSCIRTLYYAGCDINSTNGKGFTTLQLAANFGHVNLIKWLLKKGASTFIEPCPLLIARNKGHKEVVALLENTKVPSLE